MENKEKLKNTMYCMDIRKNMSLAKEAEMTVKAMLVKAEGSRGRLEITQHPVKVWQYILECVLEVNKNAKNK